MRKTLLLLAIALLVVSSYGQNATPGMLYATSKNGAELGACPLKTTHVNTEISGFIARVNVRQVFENHFAEPIEAVYTFPLSQNGAVDQMTMTVGSRTIRGKIMKREEAREVYETAKSAGQMAALLDQQRPNIFTQAVANVMPGETVVIEISYVETLKYEDGEYEFVFPMTVGPRYIPGSVSDAGKIRPPVARTRAGHDISINIDLNAGVPVEAIRSSSHQIDQVNFTPNRSNVTLREEKVIPNKDFILRYDVTGGRIHDAVLTHRGERGGFFTLILQPPDRAAAEDRTPKEIVFVLDTSGSMWGFPLEKAKEAMMLSLDGLYPEDTFNLITFSGDTSILFERPVPATQANLEMAKEFLASRSSGGGSEMMKAIRAALAPSNSQKHIRIVCFMTDGLVGNDSQIIAEIQRHPNARVFSFGIGSSVNRFLLDKMAEAGNGEAEYVSLADDGSKAAKRFYERVRTPLLMDVSIDWNGMPVADVYPGKLGDLFSARPIIVNGRFLAPASGTIKLKGWLAGQEYVREIAVDFPEAQPENDSLATLWARKRVDELSSEALNAGNASDLNKQIADLGLEFRLLTNFTSFVAVEERIVNHGGTPTRVDVPVAIPEGVDRTMAGAAEQVAVASGQARRSSVATQSSADGLPLATRSPQALAGLRSGATVQVTGVDEISEVVTVEASPETINSTSSTLTNTVSTQDISALPFELPMQSSVGGIRQSSSGSGRGSGTGSGAGSGPPPSREADSTFRRLEVVASLSRPPAVSYGVVNGHAVSLPKPQYPPAAMAVNATGAVSVLVTIDEKGNVVAAEAISGHPLLRPAAVNAARLARFRPSVLSGKPVRANGMIVYNFVDSDEAGETSVSAGNLAPYTSRARALTPEMVREWTIKAKLHSWVYDLMVRVKSGSKKTGSNEGAFVHDGEAKLRIVLRESSTAILDELKRLGFVLDSEKDDKTVLGRIPIDRISDLSEIEEIELLLPWTH
ncbi:MAG TPA: VIT domain-containing protein [Pyrinomonadaceae bacterium]|nr:VIT domain-containing protein [Pyrinomonadaceae bacterium]HMP66971.1 VIT domain-containing protein [Pyrinomonadaceae bacterium]